MRPFRIAIVGSILAVFMAGPHRIAPPISSVKPATGQDIPQLSGPAVADVETPFSSTDDLASTDSEPALSGIAHLIGLLESPSLLDGALLETRAAALKELRAAIHAGGEPLLLEMVSRIQHGDAQERRMAMLVLAQVDPLPSSVLAVISTLPGLEGRVYSLLRSKEIPTQAGDRSDVDSCDDSPLLETARLLSSLLALAPEQLESCEDEDFKSHYSTHFVRVLREIWNFIPAADRHPVDLDGDGLPESVIATDLRWGDGGWHATCPFIAVLRRPGAGSAHEIDFFERLHDSTTEHTLVEDCDGDGRVECAVFHREIGGCGKVTMISASLPAEDLVSRKRNYGVNVLRLSGESPLFCVTGAHLTMHTGTAVELTGTLAFSKTLYRWFSTGFREVGVVYLPLPWLRDKPSMDDGESGELAE